jgi:hypothetical protein
VSFTTQDLARLGAAEEIEIETRSSTGDVHRAIVWPVVEGGAVFVRSYLGARGRWYREAIADPLVAIHLGGDRLAARVVPATDPASIEACSAGLARKHPTSPSIGAMLAPEILDTTLRLESA